MNDPNIKRSSADELRKQANSGESLTDMARVRAMSENALERAIRSDPDWADVPENWYERAEAVMPKPKVAVSIRLDADLVEHFKAGGRGWQTRINAILRAYKHAGMLR